MKEMQVSSSLSNKSLNYDYVNPSFSPSLLLSSGQSFSFSSLTIMSPSFIEICLYNNFSEADMLEASTKKLQKQMEDLEVSMHSRVTCDSMQYITFH